MKKEEKIEKLEYISMEMENGNYTILNDSISKGTVFKIPFRGDLEEDNFEIGYLYIPKGSAIKKHVHTNDIEMYRLIDGILSVDGIKQCNNMCFIGESHNIDKVECDTFIETFKVNKKYLDSIFSEYTTDKEKTLIKVYNRVENELSI